MISPELLRRYPFFSFLNHDQLREVAMITNEIEVVKGDVLFENGEPADAWYLLMEGSIDLHYVVVNEHNPELRKDFTVGTINPGEVLGISAVIEPYMYTSKAVAVNRSRMLKTDAKALRALAKNDHLLECGLQRMMAKAGMERLHATRIQLAAASAPD